jgi:hypothetical protein
VEWGESTFKQIFKMVFKEIVDAQPKPAVQLAPMDSLPPRGGHHSAAPSSDPNICRQKLRAHREQLRRRAAMRMLREQCRKQCQKHREFPNP